MLYAFFMTDREHGAEIRDRIRHQHRAYLKEVADRIAFAGVLTEDGTTKQIGSLMAIDFESRTAAQLWLADEPFNTAGLFESVRIEPFINLWPQKTEFPPA